LRQHIAPKRWHLPTKLHGVTSQNSVIFKFTAVRTSALTLNNKLTLKTSYNLFDTETCSSESRITLDSGRFAWRQAAGLY